LFGWVLLALIASAGTARADKSGVVLEAPEQVTKGAEVTMKIHVGHSSNSLFHHTNWVRVKVNGEEVRRWDYDSLNHLPPGAKFTKEMRFIVSMPTEVEAEANCNLHGSKGPDIKKVLLK